MAHLTLDYNENDNCSTEGVTVLNKSWAEESEVGFYGFDDWGRLSKYSEDDGKGEEDREVPARGEVEQIRDSLEAAGVGQTGSSEAADGE